MSWTVDGAFGVWASRFEVHQEFLPLVFAAAIRMENLDFCAMLGFAPGLVIRIGWQGLQLLREKIDIGESGLIVDESDIVTFPTLRRNWHWPPNIGMDLPRKFGRPLAPSLLRHGFARGFRVNAGFAKEGVVRGCLIKMDTGNKLDQ